MKRLWIILGAVFVFSFAILGWVGTEIFRQAPPIPKEVVTTDGTVLIAAEQISDGQNVWQAMGGKRCGVTSDALRMRYERAVGKVAVAMERGL